MSGGQKSKNRGVAKCSRRTLSRTFPPILFRKRCATDFLRLALATSIGRESSVGCSTAHLRCPDVAQWAAAELRAASTPPVWEMWLERILGGLGIVWHRRRFGQGIKSNDVCPRPRKPLDGIRVSASRPSRSSCPKRLAAVLAPCLEKSMSQTRPYPWGRWLRSPPANC